MNKQQDLLKIYIPNSKLGKIKCPGCNNRIDVFAITPDPRHCINENFWVQIHCPICNCYLQINTEGFQEIIELCYGKNKLFNLRFARNILRVILENKFKEYWDKH